MKNKVVNNTNKFSKKTIGIISILALSDVLVMAAPFYLKNVMSSVLISQSLGIQASEFSQATSIYGYISLLSYFVGGYFADKFSLKKLTLSGLFLSGVVGIWYGFIPFINSGKLIQVYVIFSLWSFLTCFVFWSALWKLLSEQGTPEQNGKLNGIHGSLNGLIGCFVIGLAYLLFWLFSVVWKESLGSWAFSGLVFVLCTLIFLNCLLMYFFVPEIKKDKVAHNNQFDIKSFSTVLKNYKIWLVTLLIMGVYMYQSGLSVFVTFIQDALGVTAIIVIILGVCRTYLFRFLFSTPAGKIADKSQKYILFIIFGLIIASVLCITATLIPGFTSESFNNMSKSIKITIQVIVSVLYLMLGITCWALVTNRWATIYEINIDQKHYALSVGFISFIAFSPDAWFWQIDSIMLKNLGTEAGYSNNKLANQASLLIITTIGLLAIICGVILLFFLKKEAKKLAKSQRLQSKVGLDV